MPTQITHIAFSGGGFSGLVYLGVLQYIAVEKLHVHIRHITGTSIGALMAAALCMQLWDFDLFIREFIPTVLIPRTNIVDMFSSYGFVSTDLIVKPLVQAMEKHGYPADITFIDLAKLTGKRLIIAASCVDTTTPCYFSLDTTPHVAVVDAVRASCAIPMIFQPVKIQEQTYVDGCLTDNLPIKVCIGSDTNMKQNILVLSIHGTSNDDISSFFGFCSKLSMFMMTKKIVDEYPNHIHFEHPRIPIMPFKFDKEGARIDVSSVEIDHAIVEGLECTHAWFTRFQQDALRAQEDPLPSDHRHIQLSANREKE